MHTIHKKSIFAIILGTILFVLSANYVGFTIFDFIKLQKITKLLEVPNFSYIPELINPTIDTLAMAYTGTFLGVVFSTILGILAARNITIHSIFYNISRIIIMIARVIPDAIWAFLLIPAVGLGAIQGIFAVAIHSTGMIGRFIAESIEEIDKRPLEALEIFDATYFQKLVYGVFSQILPSFVNYILYALDHNIRIILILGFFGVGGLGFQFIVKFRVFKYDDVFAILFVIFIILYGLERFSSYIRKKMLEY